MGSLAMADGPTRVSTLAHHDAMTKATGYAVLDATLPRLERIPTLDSAALDEEQVALLGRKQGVLTTALRSLGSLPLEERKRFGAAVNRIKSEVEQAIRARREELEAAARRTAEFADGTMPGRRSWVGVKHPVTRVVDEITEIFRALGFTRAIGPEAETEWYNFGALNFPPDHPAMDMHDTLYLDVGDPPPDEPGGRVLLRTHTSPVQIRTMLAHPPPIRSIMPGMVYRKDTFDASHAPAFSQVEGLVVDEGTSFVDLKATLLHFAHEFFSPTTRVRFRPSFFPFTEPSAEMDIGCLLCGATGCPACKGSGWMEILGCGMVHPIVLENCNIDSERYTGYAFGMGPHRIAMLRYGIPDIRLLFDGDMRFLTQFGI